MYSYDVSASPGRSATASRSIPGMRPSYDAEHPHSATPIYDELYSEYRRLFRALPGDRTGEEDLAFTGFAVRDGYPVLGEQRSYPPQQQAFHTFGGQVPGLPQFMPGSQQHGSGHGAAPQHGHTGHHAGAHPAPHPGNHTGSHTGSHPDGGRTANPGTGRHHAIPRPATEGTGPVPPARAQEQASPQFTNGQGWVAAGYLGAAPLPVPAPAPPAPPAPAPVMGTATGLAPAPSTGGRHRQMLSLPPGPTVDHR
ncbi:hypothetical protein [Kitasatospora sp. NPDC018619]|uniref:hypothetical protein n=1 Tax=unclassified Kitasatospora TaxID=2633591 RepID=UPI0037B1E3AE